MSYTITLDATVLASGVSENVVVLADTNGGTPLETAIAIDYSNYYKRITTAIETLATNSTSIVQKLTSIEDHLNTLGTAGNLASKITTISEEITTIDNNILTVANEITTIDNNILTIANEITTIDNNILTVANEITTIDNNILTVANEITTIDNNILTVANEITTIDNNIDRIRLLGDYTGVDSALAKGFKTRDDVVITNKLANVALWKLYIEDGEILRPENIVSEQEQQNAINKVNSIITKLESEF